MWQRKNLGPLKVPEFFCRTSLRLPLTLGFTCLNRIAQYWSTRSTNTELWTKILYTGDPFLSHVTPQNIPVQYETYLFNFTSNQLFMHIFYLLSGIMESILNYASWTRNVYASVHMKPHIPLLLEEAVHVCLCVEVGLMGGLIFKVRPSPRVFTMKWFIKPLLNIWIGAAHWVRQQKQILKVAV